MQRSEVIFVVDPMCSWCWGFAPVMEHIRQNYSDTYRISLVMGGLRKAGDMVWDEAAKAYLASQWDAVAARTGQPFDHALLQKPFFEYDTTPACKAVVTVWELLGSDKAFVYLHKIQHAFYANGIDITNPRLLQGYYEQCFGNSSKFAFFYMSERAEALTEHDFAKARSMGANAFPSLVHIDKEGHMVCQTGYRTQDEIETLLKEKDA